MLNLLYFQIPIFFLLLLGAIQDYRTRTVSNKIVLSIVILSLPMILVQKNFLIPVLICILFLGLFYITSLDCFKNSIFKNSIGGADVKVLIPILLSVDTNSIFIFFFLYSISNVILIFRFWRSIPLYISILFGYFGIVTLSFLPIIIRIIFAE